MKLFLCEKPSQGRDIAKIVGAIKRADGCIVGDGVTVTWAFGHLLEMTGPEGYGEQYKQWNMASLPIIPQQWQLSVKPEAKKQFKVIQSLLKKATTVIIATDADREGETIARQLLEYCQYKGKIQRLWLSALDDASIRKGLSSLKTDAETYPLYLAGLGRARADWLVGMNMTRVYTLLGRSAGLQKTVLSVGRVQTPTLRLVVDRDRQITSFIPKPFWSLFLTLNTGTDSFIAEWLPPENVSDEDNRCIHEQAARLVSQHVQQSGQAIVNSIETKRTKESAPLPFDLGTLQQVCSKKWSMSAQQVLTIAQSLYETHKATTYPRTDCGYLPESMFAEVPRVLAAMIKTDPQRQPLIARLNPQFKSRAWSDKKISAHHGIIPTMQPTDPVKMTDEERKVYNLICSHYLAQFLPLHECDKTQVILTSANQQFLAQGKVIIAAGWKTLFSKDLDDACSELGIEQNIPTMTDGQRCSVTNVDIRVLKTKPPEHFTDGTLIAAMKNAARFVTDERLKQRLKENAGIGTEATRAGIIETLLKRGYLVKKKRFLVSSDTATMLIDAIPDVIKDPGTTALWEQALDSIASGELKLDDFLAKQSVWIGKIVEYAKQQSLVK